MPSVLVLIKGLGRGGAEQLLATAAPHLARARFDYQVAYVLPHKDALVPELRAAGLEVTCLGGGSSVSWVPRLRSLVRRRRIDVIHAHSPVPAVAARIVAPRSVRIVYTEHNVWHRLHPLTYWANLLTFSRNDHVFAVSDHVRMSIRGLRPKLAPIETLYHGLDHDAVAAWAPANGIRRELGIPDRAPLVGVVANFKHHKGHRYIVRAARAVRERIPDVRFVLAGVGPLESETRRLVRESGLEDAFVFAGFRSDIPSLVQAIDVFALASTSEGLSIALLEAMALGKPAVVTAVGGLPEVVRHGEQGLLVPPADPPALARAIVSLLENPDRIVELGRAARLRAAEFDIRSAVRRMEEVYEAVLSRRPTGLSA